MHYIPNVSQKLMEQQYMRLNRYGHANVVLSDTM